VQIVVQEWERVLIYRDGRFEENLGPGRHRRRSWRRRHVRVSIRSRLLVVPGQDVLTADGVAVKVSLTAAVRTADPRRWHESAEVPDAFVYSALQVALREVVAVQTLEELLAGRGALADRVRERVGVGAEAVGVAVNSLAVRDVMVPAEIRRAATDVVTARARGQAVLERARSEVAATRALANAARMIAEQPALLQLRTLQAVEAGGATVVLTQGTVPVTGAGTSATA
jgi:regulator of protease activity HflC (stomatin/prohibitin superfamily)